jgi:hypothetical protein
VFDLRVFQERNPSIKRELPVLDFNLPLKIFAVCFRVFTGVADQMMVPFGVLHRALVKCSSISEEHTVFINSVTLKMEDMFFQHVGSFSHQMVQKPKRRPSFDANAQ